MPYYRFSRCLTYGGGLLETLLAAKGQLVYFARHYSRLVRSLNVLYPKIPFIVSQDNFLAAFNRLLERQTNPGPFRVSLKVFVANDRKSFHYIMEISPHRPSKRGIEIDEERVVLDHPYRRHKLTAYSISFLNKTLPGGFDETLSKDRRFRDQFVCGKHGKVMEALRANLALIRQNTLYLVDLQQNILPGVTQEILAENHRRWFKHLELVDGFAEEDIQTAEEMLYLNSLAMCRPIRRVGKMSLKSHFAPLINQFLFSDNESKRLFLKKSAK